MLAFILDLIYFRSYSFYATLKWSCFNLLWITFLWSTFHFFAGDLKLCNVIIHLKFCKVTRFHVQGDSRWVMKCTCTLKHHNQGLSCHVRRWVRRCSQSSKNDFFDVCFPVSMADFHSLLLQVSFSPEVLVMLNAFRSRFSTSRKRNFGRPIGRGALGSSLYRTCFGRRLSSIWHTWPAHRRCLMMVMRS